MNLITKLAREIRTKFLPTNYTPSEPNVQGHIEGIDIAIGAKMDKDTDGTTGNLTVLDASGNAVDAEIAPGYWMQRTAVDAGETVTIPTDHQMIVYGDFTAVGDLVADGDLVIL